MSNKQTGLDKATLWLGILIPGGGQLKRGDWLAGLFVALGTAFLWLSATLELVVNNMRGYPAPLKLLKELAALSSPLILVPHVIVAVLFALTFHMGAAWFAAKVD